MKNNMLLENLSRKVGANVSVKRYNLADMISESYKTVYEMEEGSNLKRLAESHLQDVKQNPRDIERLSRQLSTLKELARMEESNELKDEDLVDKKSYDTVKPNKERAIQDECNESEDIGCQDLPPHVAAKCTAEKAHAKAIENREKRKSRKTQTPKQDIKEADDPELTDEELEELSKHLETIRKERKNAPKTEMKESAPKRRGVRRPMADSVKPEDEELDKKVNESDSADDAQRDFQEKAESLVARWSDYMDRVQIIEEMSKAIDVAWEESLGESKNCEVEEKCTESYRGLQNFKKQSECKAFYKTFKKMHESLKEGKALTRQESIGLYKAANSALTQMSIELEHNPKFLKTFNEASTLLSTDVNSLRESLARGKAPSKKTMKSLAKFSEALLCESKSIEDYIVDAYRHFTDDLGRTPSVDDILIDLVDNYDLEDSGYSDDTPSESSKLYDKILDTLRDNDLEPAADDEFFDSKKVNESGDENDLPDDADLSLTDRDRFSEADEEDEDLDDIEAPEDEDFVGDDEGDVQSEEADAFDQEYADARVALHKELAEKHADDPDVLDKLAQDAEEVTNLPGITDEQIAELNGEESEEEVPGEEGEESTEDESPEEDDETVINTEDGDEITDDELEELKNHLKEMRSAKLKESEGVDLVTSVKDALDDAGIRYQVRGRKGDQLIVAKKDLDKASEIRDKIDPDYKVTVATPA